ncbi:hypothetical protein STENM223S_04253 [Streptomyces tendae]
MQLWRGGTATARRTALALAVLAGSLGAAPVATAAPAPDPSRVARRRPGGRGRRGRPAGVAAPALPARERRPVRVTEEVAVVAERGADPYALEVLKDVLREAGARRFTDPGAPVPEGALVVRAGHARASADPLRALPAGGYTLASGDGSVSLTGADGDGLFHAVQTLRRLVRADGTLAAAVVRDWPATAVRASPRASTASRGRTGSGSASSTSWAAPSSGTCTRPATTCPEARWSEPYPAERRAESRAGRAGRAQPRARARLAVAARTRRRRARPRTPLSVPRGTPVRVPVEATVKPGSPTRSYDVRLGFGDAARTLTVRRGPARRRTRPARTGRAQSSADETPDFPASAANDGDPATRWSSPAEDDAWWQVELDRPVRLGKVDLHWQDARAWRTASRSPRTAAPGARRRRSTTAAAAGRRYAWKSRTSATSASRASSGYTVRVLAVVGGGVRGRGLIRPTNAPVRSGTG